MDFRKQRYALLRMNCIHDTCPLGVAWGNSLGLSDAAGSGLPSEVASLSFFRGNASSGFLNVAPTCYPWIGPSTRIREMHVRLMVLLPCDG